MKLLKKLATLGMALTLCLGVGAALTACDKEEPATANTSSSEEKEESVLKFKIVDKNGAPLAGYKIQLCIAGGTSCLTPSDLSDAEGNVEYKNAQLDLTKSYDVHLLDENNTEIAATDFVTKSPVTPADYNSVITVKYNK